MKKIIVLVVFVFLIVAGVLGYKQFQKNEIQKNISSFEECAAAGLPVRESYPPQCSTPDGKSFTQEIGNELQFHDEIQVNNPRPNQKITSPFTVSGQARGSWYFEANFPVELIDETGKSLSKGVATAQGEWMTEAFVPFTAEITFEKPTTAKGKLIINNSNPSGLPENEKELVIPVMF